MCIGNNITNHHHHRHRRRRRHLINSGQLAVSKRPFKSNRHRIGNENPIRLFRVVYLRFGSEDMCRGRNADPRGSLVPQHFNG